MEPITSETELQAAIIRLNALLDKVGVDFEEIDQLSDTIRAYETAHYAIPPLSSDEYLRIMIEERGLFAQDLARETGVPENDLINFIYHEVPLRPEQRNQIARFLHINPQWLDM